MSINERFKALRSKLNLSPTDMADRLGLTIDEYASIELGTIQPTKEHYIKLIQAFPEVPLEDFFQIYELDSGPIEQVVKTELNKISAHYFQMSSEVEKMVLFSHWLKSEMNVNDEQLRSYVPLIKKLKNIDPDLLAQIIDEKNEWAQEPIRLLLRGKTKA